MCVAVLALPHPIPQLLNPKHLVLLLFIAVGFCLNSAASEVLEEPLRAPYVVVENVLTYGILSCINFGNVATYI